MRRAAVRGLDVLFWLMLVSALLIVLSDCGTPEEQPPDCTAAVEQEWRETYDECTAVIDIIEHECLEWRTPGTVDSCWIEEGM